MRFALLRTLPIALILVACGSGTAAGSNTSSEQPAGVSPHCRSGTTTMGSKRVAVAAFARRPLRAYRRPGRHAFAHFGLRNQNGFATVFRVLAVRRKGCRPAWYRVQLPLRPNGITGFVRAAKVGLEPVHSRIYVSVSARKLILSRNGRPVLRTTVAVGSPRTPTPTGSYYVNQRLIPADTSGPFGPGAIGISAFSNVLTGWAQGGPIGIHGTNEPWSIGHAVSNGCIRVRNPVLRRLFRRTPAGTPVVIGR
jgi:lipoprotein-anchoring transpeptidase ErfK/SrfK